jgi:hypothetical protein
MMLLKIIVPTERIFECLQGKTGLFQLDLIIKGVGCFLKFLAESLHAECSGFDLVAAGYLMMVIVCGCRNCNYGKQA